ncbi:hypothetical protein [Curtobacterium sp. Leaf261]|uniref:hypothetical protein n=1 Tax=Curtobacterium sp. Leaf261 TaxID=1736311 RepID=UPI0006F3009B|nr:hypothetical protein [Curtobacterium sp. Leaf261]KQO63720.1 hypothetical protein ASF23_05740 [Curtobacterium sp. Leaf261]
MAHVFFEVRLIVKCPRARKRSGELAFQTLELRRRVADALSARLVLPSQVFERLTQDKINP